MKMIATLASKRCLSSICAGNTVLLGAQQPSISKMRTLARHSSTSFVRFSSTNSKSETEIKGGNDGTTNAEALKLAQAQQDQQQQLQQQKGVHEKSLLGKLADRFSIRGQQHRIQMGERLFQAATRQANDP